MAKQLWIVHCAAEAFRRAGIAFSRGANELDASVLSKDQVAALEAEPMLSIDKTAKADSKASAPAAEKPKTEAK